MSEWKVLEGIVAQSVSCDGLHIRKIQIGLQNARVRFAQNSNAQAPAHFANFIFLRILLELVSIVGYTVNNYR